MTDRALRNIAASVRDRLLNRSRETGEDFQFLLQRYAAERFLYRLGKSPYRDRFVLKGAMLFALWGGTIYRATRDLDFTGYGDSETETVLACFRDLCSLRVDDDGVVFDASTLTAEPILDDAEYNGLRVRFQATLGSARIPMPVDVGFGNAIEPPAADVEYPVLLDGPAPWIRAYPHEAVVAEKLHAIHRFGETNSRFKDFYDLYVLSEQFGFEGEQLARAVAATFQRRSTPIEPVLPAGLAPRFYSDGQRAEQWRAYLARNGLPGAPADFDAVGERLRAFLGPVWSALADGSTVRGTWQCRTGWVGKGPVAGEAPTHPVQAHPTLAAPPASTAAPVAMRLNERPVTAGPRRFKPYPAYKDSGVEWLGEIPAHWKVRRLKHLAVLNPESLPEDTDPAREIVYVDIGSVDSLGRIVEREQLTFASAPSRARRLVRHGDVIVSTVRTYLRAIAPIGDPEADLVVSTGFAVVRPEDDITTGYAAYALRSPYFVERVVANSKGVSFPAINESEMATYELAVPPEHEQRAIAAFLDRETAKIDALVAKKERLIELLQEKRTALTTQAVTKCLDPSVLMKDSGVEWLGEIPAHWDVKRLKYVVADPLKYGANEAAELIDPDLPRYIRITDVQDDGTLRDDTFRSIPEEVAQPHLLTEGDILFARSGATVGKTFRYDLSWGRAAHAGYLIRARLDEHCAASKFVLYFTHSAAYWDWILRSFIQATIQNVSAERYANLFIPVPPLSEQDAIVEHLDRETAKIDSLVAKVREAMERLKEYRTALISAAVTGKIDVREEAA